MPDAAARKLTGHELNFVNVVVYVKKLASCKVLLHYCKGHNYVTDSELNIVVVTVNSN